MAVKLEVIIYTDENGTLRVRSMGAIDKKGFTDKEVGVRQRLWEVMNQTLNKEFNGVDLFSVGVDLCAHNTH
ncbi:TPA: hypothetical protein OBO46_001953 [Escherichia coli]|uniref:hypothetical protein n=1 Tax=Escherichia coli TaxID=562 RepID=UPI0022000A6B|nr:hypothetical protein [Escherichia coli]MDM8858360.1 hypothetical protein [Escherichia coli]MDM8863368.1 hypothetical protein [Escherichia coli]MDM8868260.1 hypothetical protein [Escherichia coli]WJW17470.1 hypothetical protein QVM98_20265 [Escherichia coli]BDO96838.1 hypothetical protein TUM9812_39260 [Escherichia coli]